MTTQLKQANKIASELSKLLQIVVSPCMSVAIAKKNSFKLERHQVGFMMWFQPSEGNEVSAMCPIARKVLKMSHSNKGMYQQILADCIKVWQTRIKLEFAMGEIEND